MSKGILSVQRASALLRCSGNQEDFVIIKLKPEPYSCCCFRHWPETWSTINRYIAPSGPIENEGDALIVREDHEFVIECHESGPEIVFYLGLATVSLGLVKSVVDLITVFVKALQDKHRETPARIKVVSRRIIEGSDKDEILIELDLPLSNDITDILNTLVKKALQKNTE